MEDNLWISLPEIETRKVLGECKKTGFKSISESTSGKRISVGDKVQVVDCSGTESGKKGTVIHQSKIKTTGRGIPAEIPGAYRPVDWKREVAIEYEDGSLGTMAKNRLIILDEDASINESWRDATKAEYLKVIVRENQPRRHMNTSRTQDVQHYDMGKRIASKHITLERGKPIETAYSIDPDYLEEE